MRPWARQLKQWNVMQLTMPPLKADTSYVHFLKEHSVGIPGEEYNPYTTAWSTSAAIALRKMRPWHDTEFRGSSLLDFLNANATESAIRKIIADTSHAGGVRIQFLPGATYANLVKVLDIMNYTNQKKYWLDIRHEPTTFYAITDKPLPRDTTPVFICGFVASKPQPIKSTFQRLVVEVGQKISSLQNQAWRLPILLLVIISSLSLWRMVYHKPNYHNS